MAAHLLRRHGYVTVEAASGEEALQIAARGERIDLVLTDVVLHGITGRELWERLSASRPGLRAVFCSGYTDETDLANGIGFSGHCFLQKPFTVARLLALVRETLDT